MARSLLLTAERLRLLMHTGIEHGVSEIGLKTLLRLIRSVTLSSGMKSDSDMVKRLYRGLQFYTSVYIYDPSANMSNFDHELELILRFPTGNILGL